ncbi:hypothetical protein PAQU9191_01061 [Photobacterium aquimaris]|uniref:Uncharacterized protein n=1 Tax=Photobacterium aquimaris TaxID=512643 RepID=A0A1Y6KUF9_9GAMM|nr:hypothetical protein PAQU9191_01061 [Photobacterium aquimaris]
MSLIFSIIVYLNYNYHDVGSIFENEEVMAIRDLFSPYLSETWDSHNFHEET